MRAVTLGIGTFAILYIPLDMILDVRGANDLVRPFHLLCLLVTVLVSVLVMSLVSRYWKPRSLAGRLMMALSFVHVVIILWAFALPLGDRLAIRKERQADNVYDFDERGPGWFYWDDSGMGNWPMNISYFVSFTWFDLVWMGMFLTFVALTFLQGANTSTGWQKGKLRLRV